MSLSAISGCAVRIASARSSVPSACPRSSGTQAASPKAARGSSLSVALIESSPLGPCRFQGPKGVSISQLFTSKAGDVREPTLFFYEEVGDEEVNPSAGARIGVARWAGVGTRRRGGGRGGDGADHLRGGPIGHRRSHRFDPPVERQNHDRQ